MAERRIDFGTLSLKDFAIGIGLVVLAIALLSGLFVLLNLSLPGFVASAGGGAIGVALWFLYLFKRNS
ncbi:MAG: hypothetical protein KIT02_03535 [Devosia sp.]|uniref:hypothetical protein n=1 Tax=Devosia sp. TaxID=1871048 RepID=UPI0024C86E84|nr:hypothetical protein [Devosia sp.]UYO00305.1 MAG: hypothetical protein KIT02_03535 [Devosia sp.]